MKNLACSLLAAAALLLAPACGDDDDTTANDSGGNDSAQNDGGGNDTAPPADGGQNDTTTDITISFEVVDPTMVMNDTFQITNVVVTGGFTLAAPGNCAGDPNCGHYHICESNVMQCGAGGNHYIGNDFETYTGVSSPDLTWTGGGGDDMVCLSLRQDDHNAFMPTVSACVPITVL